MRNKTGKSQNEGPRQIQRSVDRGAYFWSSPASGGDGATLVALDAADGRSEVLVAAAIGFVTVPAEYATGGVRGDCYGLAFRSGSVLRWFGGGWCCGGGAARTVASRYVWV